MSSQQLQIPLIDFSHLDPKQPNGSLWDETRTKVFSALETYGCFNTIYNGVESELKETLFGSVLPGIFELPLERKQLNKTNNYKGYYGKLTDAEYESLAVLGVTDPLSVEKFTRMLYPEGNQLLT
ncbi:hypothetical protein LUZ60_003229 [Juncus effusus]|nr:hypothetical protein LUZ60_003229 [Juncus effusus]